MHIMILIRMSVKSSENTNQNTVTDSVINFLIWWKKLTTKSTEQQYDVGPLVSKITIIDVIELYNIVIFLLIHYQF